MKAGRIAALSAAASLSVTGLGAQAPGGTLLVLNKVDATLAFVDPASHKVLSRVPTGEGPHEVIPPGSSRAYIAVNGDNQVAVVDLARLEVVARISAGNGPDGMAWIAGR